MNDKTDQPAGKIQGEGDYEAARRYREKVSEFVQRTDIDKLASQAEPLSAREARDNALAEESAKARSKGDDPADVGIMYTHAKPNTEA